MRENAGVSEKNDQASLKSKSSQPFNNSPLNHFSVSLYQLQSVTLQCTVGRMFTVY